MGIAVYAIDCAHSPLTSDVFRLVASTTRGVYLPLHDAALLVPLIASAAATELDKQRIDARVRELLRNHGAALDATDEAERVRWLVEALREDEVRPRAMVPPPQQGGPAPLVFRPIEPTDVEGALDRIGRALLA